MMPIIFKKYDNSVIATLMSFFGSVIIAMPILLVIEDIKGDCLDFESVLIYICIALLGVGLRFFAKHIYEKKVVKILKKNVKEKNMESEIRTSTELAVAIYNKAQCKPVQKYISELNPAAGEIIKQNKAAKK